MKTSGKHHSLRAVVLYSGGHLGSAAIVSTMARMSEFEIVGFVRADPAAMGRLDRAVRRLRKMGLMFAWLLLWQRLIMDLGFALGRLLPVRRRFGTVRDLAEDRNVPLLNCRNVNDAEVRQWIAGRKPDLIISACFSQILKNELIGIPKIGTLNIHPGYLPSYRGAMAYFWPLRCGDRHAGVSVHWIDEGIDTGPLLARRKLKMRPRTTQQRVLVRSAVAGAYLLRRVARDLIAGQSPAVTATDAAGARYFHFPSAADVAAYMRHHRFFRIRDLLGLLLKPALR